MVLKPGYKQTEVGIIPKDWDVRIVSDICTLINGRGFKPHEWESTGLPIIRIQNLNGSDDFNYYSGIYNQKIIVENKQLLFAWSGSRGTSFGPHLWGGGRALLNYHTWKVDIDVTKIDTTFFFYALRHLTSSIEDAAHGASALVHTQKGEMEQIPLAIPPLPEQRAIAAALSDTDALLSSLDRLLAKKRDIKQAVMQQLLTGKQRLPGFSGEWKVKRLEELGEVASAGVDKKSHLNETPVRLLNYLDVYKKDFIFSSDLNHLVTAPQAQANRCQIRKGDVFFTPSSEVRDDIAHCAVAIEDILDAAYSYHIVRLRVSENWDLRFRAYAFKSKTFFDQAHMLCDGSGTRYVISQGKFRSMTVLVPPIPEQTAIAAVLSDMDAELDALRQRRDKTRAIKQGIMQELLTGRTRLV